MPLFPSDAFRPSAAQWRAIKRERDPELWRRIDRLKGSTLSRWKATDLEFFLSNRENFLPITPVVNVGFEGEYGSATVHGGAPHLDAYGSEIPAQTAMESRVTVVPKFGLLWVGIAALVTVGVTAVWHGSRHERESRAGTGNR